MESEDGNVTVSIRYRPGNLSVRPAVKVSVDDGEPFSLSNEGVKRVDLEPGVHDFKMRCRLRKKRFSVNVDSPTKITIGFCRDCGKIKARADAVSSIDDLDFERVGY